MRVVELEDRINLDAEIPVGEPPIYNSSFNGPVLQDNLVPQLASLPSAKHTIYLDFDGHVTLSGTTSWGTLYGNINTPPFDIDGNPGSFSTEEQNRIRDMWKLVSEDYAPFNVNVTTVEPPVSDLIKVNTSDERWGVRVCIGGSYSDWYGKAFVGIAFNGSFNFPTDTPAFVFADTASDSVKWTGEAISHEVGHTLGLSHDGRSSPSEAYYLGHGSGETGWAPIMGGAYYQPVTQFSKGEYPFANNKQDDLLFITTPNGFSYRQDDYQGVTLLGADLNVSGIIEKSDDTDVFSFVAANGLYSFNINPNDFSPNLDIKAELYDSKNNLVFLSNPINKLSASFSQQLTPGTYTLHIKNDASENYTNYASLGQYRVSIIEPLVVDDMYIVGQQRSMVDKVYVDFNHVPGGFSGNPFLLLRLSDNTFLPTTYLFNNNTVEVQFASVADGRYQLIVNHSNIDGLELDYFYPFHRLFGDSNGDATVDGQDFADFGNSFGNTGYSIFDYDGNGFVDGTDFAQFGNRFGLTI